VPLGLADLTGADPDPLLEVWVAVLMGLSCGLVHVIGRSLFSPTAGVVGALLWLGYPLNLYLAKQPNSEVAFTLVLLVAVWLAVRAGDRAAPGVAAGAGIGAAVGAAMLIRPAGVALILPIAAWLWLRRPDLGVRRAPLIGSVVAAAVLVVAPWVVWASAATDGVVPLSSGGRDTLMDGLEVGIGEKGTEEGRTLALPQDLRGLLRDLSDQDSDGDLPTTGSILQAIGREVPERPVGALQLVGFKAVRSWYGTESLRYETPLAAVQVATAALIAVGTVRAWRLGGTRRTALVLLLGVVACSWLLTMAVISLARYLTPALGLALVLGGVALEPWATRLVGRIRPGGGGSPERTIGAMSTHEGSAHVAAGSG
jgi:4-amino-4-deoxy-L-arabinose transferase-like glycosyltransferase